MRLQRSLRRPPWWVVAIIAVQVSVPTYMLVAGDQPRRLGFQMYSGLGGLSATAIDAEGNELVLPEAISQLGRPDLPWVEHLPEQICDIVPAAVTVTVIHRSEERTVVC